METIGVRLAELRVNHNMTQEELADCLDVSRQAVSKWELDKTLPDVNKLMKISELYQVSIDYLLKGTKVLLVDDTEDKKNKGENAVFSLQDQEEVQEDRTTDIKEKRHRHTGLYVSIILISIIMLGTIFLLVFFLKSQVWSKSGSEKKPVRVDQIYAQYSLADVCDYSQGNSPETKTVLLDINGVREGDYVNCYTYEHKNTISVNYQFSTFVIVLSTGLILFCIWVLLLVEIRIK